MVQVYILLEFHFWKRMKKRNWSSVMILTFAYSSSFGVSCAMKDGDSVVIIQSKDKRTRSGSLCVTSIYLYAITISYYSMVRYKNIDKPIIMKIIGFKWGRVGWRKLNCFQYQYVTNAISNLDLYTNLRMLVVVIQRRNSPLNQMNKN